MTGKRVFWLAGLFGVLIAAGFSAPVSAQELDLGSLVDGGERSGPLTARIIQFMGILTVLSIAPGLLIMVTSFTRIVIVLSFLRSGLGLQQSPPNIVIVSLALFLTGYVMAPTFDEAWRSGLAPLLNDEMTEDQAVERMVDPFRNFMMNNVREKDLALFDGLSARIYEKTHGEPPEPQDASEEEAARVDLRVLVPAFLVSELRRAFEIGFLIFLPFLVIDLVIATVLMAMGMMMLPPVVISLPFKILFFVLIDGWYLLTSSLVRSFI
ncbi:flagellar type III secretion system pore protein FliP [Tepidicaulis sp. LMO-SS28]|uniref:flagellar type III secretion system pore protein FliP n=1 Tax=Tepidicaulis sp. LMO-SS28 TaxID=3447455 RepID=UPI003EE0B392